MHDNVDDVIESALNSKLLSINSQQKEKQEVKNIEDVPIEESKVYSNLLFDDNEINSEEHNAEEQRIRREHAEYLSRMEMLFTINPHPCPTVNANTIVESIPSSLIPIQDNDSQQDEIDIVTNRDELLPPGPENDDLDGEINVVDDLHVNSSISNAANELFDNGASDFDNPLVPLPHPEPPDAEFDFELDAEISVVMYDNDEFECPKVEFDDGYYSFMFLIYFKVFSFPLSAESEDMIFDPGISV
nr:hypothetical protein [Tanacetum cinerariifolium]